MSRIKFQQGARSGRGGRGSFFPQLSPLARKLESITAPITDRGLTGPAARSAEDVRERLAARAAKLARRAAQAKRANARKETP